MMTSVSCSLDGLKNITKEALKDRRRACLREIISEQVPARSQIDIPHKETLRSEAHFAAQVTAESPLTNRRASFQGPRLPVVNISAGKLLFSQADCSHKFQKAVLGAYTVGELAAQLFLGTVSLSDLDALEVFQQGQEWVSCSNRRLAAIRFASAAREKKNIPFSDIIRVKILPRSCGHKVHVSNDIVVKDSEPGKEKVIYTIKGKWPDVLNAVLGERNNVHASDGGRAALQEGQIPSVSSDYDSTYAFEEISSEKYLDPSSHFEDLPGFGDFDNKRPLCAITTNFVTSTLMETSTERLRLLAAFMTGTQATLDAFSDVADLDESATVFFKGGTLSRLIISDLMSGLSLFSQRIAEPYLTPLKHLSDYDFSMLIPSTIRKDTSLLTKLNVTLFVWLLRFRNYLVNHIGHFFPMLGRSVESVRLSEALKELRQTLQDKVNDSTAIGKNNFYHGIHIEHISLNPETDEWVASHGKVYADKQELNDERTPPEEHVKTARRAFPADFAVLHAQTGDAVRLLGAHTLLYHYGMDPESVLERGLPTSMNASKRDFGDTKNLYVTHNPLLEFKRAASRIGEDSEIPLIKFALNRIKLGFIVFFRKKTPDGKTVFLKENWPGEVVDLSCNLLDEDHKKDVSEYRFVGYNFTFPSYSLEGYLMDMYQMMYGETLNKPWVEPGKMSKKTGRLSFLLGVGFALKGRTPSKLERIRHIVDLGKCMSDPEQKRKPEITGVKWFDMFQYAIVKSFRVNARKAERESETGHIFENENMKLYKEAMMTSWNTVTNLLIYEEFLHRAPSLTYIDAKFMKTDEEVGQKIM